MLDAMTIEYRKKAAVQRKLIYHLTLASFAINIGIFAMFLANLIHHW